MTFLPYHHYNRLYTSDLTAIVYDAVGTSTFTGLKRLERTLAYRMKEDLGAKFYGT